MARPGVRETPRQGDIALRESEQRFRAPVAAVSDVVYRMSPDWREMDQLRNRDSVAPSGGGNRNWLEESVHPDDQARVMEAVREAIRAKGTFQLEYRVRRADGGVGWTFSRAVPIRDEHGEIAEWFGAATNVTGRKLAEQALSARTAELETVMREVPVAIFIGHGADIDSISANPTGRKLLRVGKNSDVSLRAPDASYQICRGGRALPLAELPMRRAAATGQPVTDSELEVVFPDGGFSRIPGNAVPPLRRKRSG